MSTMLILGLLWDWLPSIISGVIGGNIAGIFIPKDIRPSFKWRSAAGVAGGQVGDWTDWAFNFIGGLPIIATLTQSTTGGMIFFLFTMLAKKQLRGWMAGLARRQQVQPLMAQEPAQRPQTEYRQH